MSVRICCRDCDAAGREDESTARDLAEGHAEKHGHEVTVNE